MRTRPSGTQKAECSMSPAHTTVMPRSARKPSGSAVLDVGSDQLTSTAPIVLPLSCGELDKARRGDAERRGDPGDVPGGQRCALVEPC